MEEISQTLAIDSFHSVPLAMTLHDITQKRGNYVITFCWRIASANGCRRHVCGAFRQEKAQLCVSASFALQ